MIKNILVPLDGSDHSKAAVDYAVWITEKFNGMLFGQHIIDTISIEGTFFHDISGSLGFEPYLDCARSSKNAAKPFSTISQAAVKNDMSATRHFSIWG